MLESNVLLFFNVIKNLRLLIHWCQELKIWEAIIRRNKIFNEFERNIIKIAYILIIFIIEFRKYIVECSGNKHIDQNPNDPEDQNFILSSLY